MMKEPPRGLNSEFAKAASLAESLSQKTCRPLELFSFQCRRRLRDADIAGTLLVMKASAWEACEHGLQGNIEPFKSLVKLLHQLS